MSRRPRLVEEGLPIEQESVEMESSDAVANMSSWNHSTDRNLPPSSLARALLYRRSRSDDSNVRFTNGHSAPISRRIEYPRLEPNSDSVMDVDDVPTTTWNYTNHTRIHHHHYTVGCDGIIDGLYWNNNGSYDCHYNTNRMEIEDLLPKPPLIVLDGANIAYSYAHVSNIHNAGPDVTGIRIAVDYFIQGNVRVQVVIPSSWIRSKRHAVLHPAQLEILHNLHSQQLLCCTPPTDDDDAYALAMARREDARARLQKFHRSDAGPKGGAYLDAGAFIVSNDFYRDAMERDHGRTRLKEWLEGSDSNLNHDCGPPGRISYSFCDLGSIDRYGSPQLDFVPNPRHALVQRIEDVHRKIPGKF